MAETKLSIFDQYFDDYQEPEAADMSLEEYLELCKADPSAYANVYERLLKAIGEPQIIDYTKEPKLKSVFEGLAVPRYPGFEGFYGMEDAAKQIVSFIRHAAQGLEESKQILYLLGPVGGGKSSVAKRMTELLEQEPFYAIVGSPIHDNPLSAFNLPVINKIPAYRKSLQKDYHIPARYLDTQPSPWLLEQQKLHGRDILKKLRVVKLYPSRLAQCAISRVEAGDKNNQDVTAIIGKVDISKLDRGLSQHDPRAYGYSGGLNRGNRGIMEYVEMFKSPIDTLNPLLAATQDRQYNGAEAIGALPFEGIILAHSNEAEWGKFKNDKTNEAFIDRCAIIKVPYTLRVSEEHKIYKAYIENSELCKAPCAPGTLEIQAKFAVLTRLADSADKSLKLETKMKVYDGQNMKTTDAKAKTLQEYRQEAFEANAREGMTGWSVRDSFKAISTCFNLHAAEGEISASPIDLMFILDRMVKAQDLPKETRERYLLIIEKMVKPEYAKAVAKEINEALMESHNDYGQGIFERYVKYAEMSLEEDEDHIDPETKSVINKAAIEKILQSIEKPAGIPNAVSFRNEVVRFVQRMQLKNNGQMPDWKEYKKFADAIQTKITASTKDLQELISFTPTGDSEKDKKHGEFVERMVKRGYTPRQVRQVVEWHNKPENKPA